MRFLIVHADPAAIAIMDDPPEDYTPGENEVLVSEESDLASLPTATLVAIYNSITRRGPVKDFHDRAQGAGRIWTLLQAPRDATPTHIEQPSDTQPELEANEANEGDTDMSATATARKGKTAKTSRKAKAKTERAPRKAKASNGAAKGPRGEKMQGIARLLQRKNGCTAAEVLELTGWPAVSMPAMAKACGLKLKKEKIKIGEDRVRTHYFGVE